MSIMSYNDRHQFIEYKWQQISVAEYKRRNGLIDEKPKTTKQEKKQDLINQLKEYDVFAGNHWKIETLEEKLEEAKEKANEDK